jgi:hypothetical protein
MPRRPLREPSRRAAARREAESDESSSNQLRRTNVTTRNRGRQMVTYNDSE